MPWGSCEPRCPRRWRCEGRPPYLCLPHHLCVWRRLPYLTLVWEFSRSAPVYPRDQKPRAGFAAGGRGAGSVGRRGTCGETRALVAPPLAARGPARRDPCLWRRGAPHAPIALRSPAQQVLPCVHRPRAARPRARTPYVRHVVASPRTRHPRADAPADVSAPTDSRLRSLASCISAVTLLVPAGPLGGGGGRQ